MLRAMASEKTWQEFLPAFARRVLETCRYPYI